MELYRIVTESQYKLLYKKSLINQSLLSNLG